MGRNRIDRIAALLLRGAAFACAVVLWWALAAGPDRALAVPSHVAGAASSGADTLVAGDSAAVLPDTASRTPTPPPAARVAPESGISEPAFPLRVSADTMNWRVELGAISDYTNEVFYQDAFIDTTFIGRDRIDNPEARVAGVLYTALEGTRSGRGSRYQLQNELTVGNLLQRDVLGLHWVTDVSPEWRLVGTPSVEFRRDESYGRNLTEWRAQVSGRARRSFLESATTLDLMASADALRTSGTGSGYVLDRNAARLGAALDQGGFSTFGFRAGYALVARQFPDSSVRSHLEHQSELRIRKDRDQGLSWGLDGILLRRVTIELAPTSRDNWWQEGGELEAEWRGSGTWSLRAVADLDAFQYDVPDSTVYFNYSTLRVLMGPRFSRVGRASVWIAPRLEWLAAPLMPGEAYREYAAQAEIEVFGRGTLLSATPVVGHREYHDDPASLTDGYGSLHSSYAFYEITLFLDQALRGGWRLRGLGTARTDLHDSATENATSLYFSLDVRRLF